MNIKTKFTNAIKKKATEFYDSASPKVQEQLEKLATTKIDEVVKTASSFAIVGFIIYSVVKAVNNPKETLRDNCMTYNEVHITNNYFYGKDDKS